MPMLRITLTALLVSGRSFNRVSANRKVTCSVSCFSNVHSCNSLVDERPGSFPAKHSPLHPTQVKTDNKNKLTLFIAYAISSVIQLPIIKISQIFRSLSLKNKIQVVYTCYLWNLFFHYPPTITSPSSWYFNLS